jgi:arylsulfatase A-like enzyme
MKVVVLHVTGLHLGHVGCYGNDWVDTPSIDCLAAEGVVFDQHFADKVSGQRSAWTGHYELPGVDAHASTQPKAASLADILAGQGVSFAWIDSTQLSEKRVIARTVKQLAKVERGVVWVDLPTLLPPWQVPDELLDRYFEAAAMDEEGEEGDQEKDDSTERQPLTPLVDPVTGPIDQRDFTLLDQLHFTYAAAVTQTDAWIGAWLDELDALRGQVVVIVTSDRGLALGEHGTVGDHRPWLHEEVSHVPLVMRLPGPTTAGRRVAALTQPVDLFATLLETLEVPIPDCHGRSLLPLARGQVARVRGYAVSGWQLDDALDWILRTPEWAFVLPLRTKPGDSVRGSQLYIKPDDRWEMNDVAQHHLERVEQFEKLLHAFVAGTHNEGVFAPPPLDAAECGTLA